MKTIIYFLALSIFLCLTSFAITENLIIKENNTGKLSYDIDMSKMMSIVGNTSEARQKKKKKESIFDKDIDSTFRLKKCMPKKEIVFPNYQQRSKRK
jgi:hypothetical protein